MVEFERWPHGLLGIGHKIGKTWVFFFANTVTRNLIKIKY